LIARADCEALDRADPLRPFRERFELPTGTIYLDGNSLGALPKEARRRMDTVLDQWSNDLISSWNIHGWIDLHERVGAKIGRLIGAGEGETIAGDSTSVQLFKALHAALALNPKRRVIVSERKNFPTDLYVAEGIIAGLGQGHELRLVDADGVMDAIRDDVAVVMLTHVSYRTGRMYDMKRDHEGSARQGRRDALGSLSFRRRGADRSYEGRSGFRRRLRLQIPQWRARRAGVSFCGEAPPCSDAAGSLRLVRTCRAVCLRACLAPR